MTRPTPPGWNPGPSGTRGKQYWNPTGRTGQGAAPPVAADDGPRLGAGNPETDHTVHLIATICTCGLWLPAWLTVTLLNRRRARVGPEPGFRGFMSAHPLPTGIAVLAGFALILVDRKAFLLLVSLVAVVTGLAMLAMVAIRSWRRRRQEKAEIAARADAQHEALLRGDDQWGVFGVKPSDEPAEEPSTAGKANRRSLVAGVAVVAGVLVFAVMATVDARSADRAPRPVSAPTVTVTRPASRPVPHSMSPPPALNIPFPFVPAPLPAPTSPPLQPPSPPVRFGQQAVDGNVTFVVTSADRSKTVANSNFPFMQTTAKGTFLTVALTITNNGKQAEVFIASDQKLRITSGVYEVDPAAALWTLTLETLVAPGTTTTATLSFDVPADTPPGGIVELRASKNSRGANVELLPPQ